MADRELKVRILGDAKGAQNAVKSTEQAFARFGPMGQRVGGVLGKLQGILEGLGGPRTAKAADSVTSGLGSIAPVAAGAAAGVAALGKIVLGNVAQFAAYAQEVRKFQRASGASADTSSRFVAVLDDLGIASDLGAAAISKLTRNADAGKLAPFNIQLAKTKDGAVDTTETLLNVADAYVATTDPAERARLRFAAFGKQGDALIPMLEKGRAGLKAFFDGVSDQQLISDDELDKAEKYRLAMDNLSDSVSDVGREVGLTAIGPVTDFANGLAAAVRAGDDLATSSPNWINKFADDVLRAAPGVNLIQGLIDLGHASSVAASDQKTLFEAANLVRDSSREQTDAVEDQTKALDELANATLAAFSADIAHERALNNLEDAQTKAAEAATALADAQKANGINSAEAKAAAEELTRANLDQQDAALQVAAAAAREAEQVAKANGQSWDAARDAIPAQIKALEELRTKLQPGSPLLLAVDEYIRMLKTVPTSITTSVNFEGPRITTAPKSRDSQGNDKVVLPVTADGGVFNGAQLRVIGEDGPEAVVPLGPSKARQRARVMHQAGLVPGWADGGIAGGPLPGSTNGASPVVYVDMRGAHLFGPGGLDQIAEQIRAALAKNLERNGITVLSYK